MKHLLFVLIITLLINKVKAQEETRAMEYSSVLNRAYQEYQKQHIGLKAMAIDTLELPFFDDFSDAIVYPKESLWINKTAYINNTFARNSPTKGVATFDGFDERGVPYVISQFAYGVCDTLTSKPLNLNYPASDSIYLSFYIQPQGFGRPPATNDSLILEFKNEFTGRFEKVLAWPGTSNRNFRQIMVPITEDKYLKRGFQFRFKNKGSQYGGDDHWHIDYVRLNRLRSVNDTSFFDVSLNNNPTSLLQSYTAVPYNQYDSTLLANNHFINIRNNYSVDPITVVTFTFTSYLKEENLKLDSVTKGLPLPPFGSDYEDSKKVSIPQRNYPYSVETKYYVTTNNDNIKQNDTITNRQIFSDYFSYDDGSAENGYGLSVSGDARFAYLFSAKQKDTLTHVGIFFTQKQVPLTNEIFTLTIWKSLNPEEIIYQKTSLSPVYTTEINGFALFELDSIVEVEADFYVGWIQASNFFMNVGLDRNTVNNDRMFFKTDALGWRQSSEQGSVMIRPIFRSSLVTGINRNKNISDFKIYPNPGNGQLNLHSNEVSFAYTIRVLDVQGRILKTIPYSQNIDLTELNKGMYLIQLLDAKENVLNTQKYLKHE